MRILSAIAICATLAGCASPDVAGSPMASAAAPLSFEDTKQFIVAERGRIWKDPDSIRDASIGRPYSCSGGLAHMADMPNVCVCVEVNARNSFGGFTGLRRNEILMKDRRVVDTMPPREPTYSCGPMTPFAELNGGAQQAAAPAPRR